MMTLYVNLNYCTCMKCKINEKRLVTKWTEQVGKQLYDEKRCSKYLWHIERLTSVWGKLKETEQQ